MQWASKTHDGDILGQNMYVKVEKRSLFVGDSAKYQMSTSLDQEFETGVRLIRDAYGKKLSQKETEVVQLRGENARKDAEIRELQIKVNQMEIQLQRADKQISEMSRNIGKLSHFKQSVLDSFEDDDYSEFRKKLHEKDSPNASTIVDSLEQNGGGKQEKLFFSGYSPIKKPTDMTQPPASRNLYSSIGIMRGDFDHQTMQKVPSYHASDSQRFASSTYNKDSLSESNYHYYDNDKKDVPDLVQASRTSGFSTQNNATSSTESLEPPLSRDEVELAQKKSSQPQQENTVDGREYFRKAKSILSYDEFTTLLYNVKAYNNREQSRLKTLESVYQSIGAKHKAMYQEFEKLLSR